MNKSVLALLTMISLGFYLSGCNQEDHTPNAPLPIEMTQRLLHSADPTQDSGAIKELPMLEKIEQLAISTPVNWQVAYRFANENMRLIEFIPSEETSENWRNKIIIEHTLDHTVSPEEFIKSINQQAKNRCQYLDLSKLFVTQENDYPTALRWQFCGRRQDHGLGEISLLKVISGKQYTYSIARIKRVDAFNKESADVAISQEELKSFTTYMQSINACHPGQPQHPCPSWYTDFFTQNLNE